MDYLILWISNFVKENKKIVKTVLYGIGFLLVIAYFPEACRSCVSSSSESSYSTDNEINAYVTSKDIISKILKAPSTANFQPYDRNMITVSMGTYTVNGYVDAQNSFGANLRSYYTVVLKGVAYNWQIEKIIFDGEVITSK